MTNLIFFFFLFLLYYVGSIFGFECYKNDGINLDFKAQYCNPIQQPYCLKANVYDGRVIRDCASAQQCPQVIFFIYILIISHYIL